MPTIPLGQGRRVLPQRTLMAQVADVSAPARALSNLGAVGVQIGQTMQAKLEAEAEVQRDATERVQTAAAQAQGLRKLREQALGISDGILSGELDDKAVAERWDESRRTVVGDVLQGLPQDLAGRLRPMLEEKAEALALDAFVPARRRRTQEETRAGAITSLEEYERDAVSNRPGAVARAQALLTVAAGPAGWGPDDVAQRLQTFRERTAANQVQHLLRVAGTDVASLDSLMQRVDSPEFDDLSPPAREQAANAIIGRKAQIQSAQDVAARRIQAQAERRMREAEDAARSLQSLIDAGAVPDAGFLANVSSTTAGTRWAPVVKATLDQAVERAGFASLAPHEQRIALQQMRAQASAQGSNPAAEKRISQLEGIATAQATKAQKDPLRWGLDTRLLPELPPLPMGSLDALAQAVPIRVDQARTVGAKLGRPVSPLTADEAQQVRDMIGGLPWANQEKAVRMLAQVLPADQGRAMAEQMGRGELSLAMLTASLPATAGNVPALILRGADAQRAGRVKKDDAAATQDQLRIAQELAKVQWPTTQARDAAAEAARLVYQGLRDEKGSARWREAVDLATGGGLADWGGSKVPVPPGWTEDRFRAAMKSVDAMTIQGQMRGRLYVAGREVRSEDLANAIGSATLLPLGPGQYAIDVGGLVMRDNGRPFVFTLRD